jgi:hypothetical protein
VILCSVKTLQAGAVEQLSAINVKLIPPKFATRTEAVNLPCFATRLGLIEGGRKTLSSALLEIEPACGRFSWKQSM